VDLRGATVAVTGATGFLGRYLVDTLLARGARVVGVVRNPERVPALVRRGVELRRADLARRELLAAGVAGADAAVSNAALFSFRNHRWEDHLATNVEGTRNVFEALSDAGVRRVVHVSSVAVYDRRRGAPIIEDHPQLSERTRRTRLTVYAISKALSEQLAWRMAAERGLQLTTVRPCTIYGAFDPNFLPIFRRLVSLPITVMPTHLCIGLVYAGDVADAIALALEREVSVGRAYNTTDRDRTIWEMSEAWREAGGRTAFLRLPLPIPVSIRFDSSRAERELGWQNRSLVEGLCDTFRREAEE
jgi:nucleoside-diphosphate-sugar epimerase